MRNLLLLVAEFDKYQPDVVIGLSRGGAVAMNIDSGDARLVLLCPAWKKSGMAKAVTQSTVILHSRADDVVPFAPTLDGARSGWKMRCGTAQEYRPTKWVGSRETSRKSSDRRTRPAGAETAPCHPLG